MDKPDRIVHLPHDAGRGSSPSRSRYDVISNLRDARSFPTGPML
jgi:hypothetical protein